MRGADIAVVSVLSRTSVMFDLDVVTLSRLQFGLTALYHFLFVPLTLGLVGHFADHGVRVCDDRA
jgi:hypothetical protein